MEKLLTPTLTKQYKFQIWSGHGKMANPPTLTEIFKFQIWSGPSTLPEHF